MYILLQNLVAIGEFVADTEGHGQFKIVFALGERIPGLLPLTGGGECGRDKAAHSIVLMAIPHEPMEHRLVGFLWPE